MPYQDADRAHSAHQRGEIGLGSKMLQPREWIQSQTGPHCCIGGALQWVDLHLTDATAITLGPLTDACSYEHDDTDRTKPEHLEAAPQADEDGDVEPSGCSGLDDAGEPQGDAKVRDGQEYGGDAPLESFACVHAVTNLVRGHVAAQVVADGDASGE